MIGNTTDMVSVAMAESETGKIIHHIKEYCVHLLSHAWKLGNFLPEKASSQCAVPENLNQGQYVQLQHLGV